MTETYSTCATASQAHQSFRIAAASPQEPSDQAARLPHLRWMRAVQHAVLVVARIRIPVARSYVLLALSGLKAKMAFCPVCAHGLSSYQQRSSKQVELQAPNTVIFNICQAARAARTALSCSVAGAASNVAINVGDPWM